MSESLLKLYLYRRYKGNDGTIGEVMDERGWRICFSLERPETYNQLKNQRDDKKTFINESCCVPEGIYQVEYTYSPSFKRNLFLLKNVEGRDGIRIHSANTIDELLGCLAPATYISKNIKAKGKTYSYYACQSKTAEDALVKYVEKKTNSKMQFTLDITSQDPRCTYNMKYNYT